jgi:tripartite-type tricarboxylate transporter receptor subunit TctC
VLSVHLQNLWGPPVVSEYRPGAAGLLGTRQVASSPADGYTLLMASTGAILALAGDRPGTGSFDIARELAPVSLIAAPPYILVANPSVPVKTTAELIAHARQNPGKVSSVPCSSRWPALTCCMCPIAAPAPRSPISSADVST